MGCKEGRVGEMSAYVAEVGEGSFCEGAMVVHEDIHGFC